MKQKLFLLADDDADDAEMFCEALAQIDEAIVCRCAENGRELLAQLNELGSLPDLIFLDINMPVMNGRECLQQLKSNDRYRHIPVFIYSTSSHQKEMDTARESGALCFLTKPTGFAELKEILAMIVANLGADLPRALSDVCGKSPGHVLTVFDREQSA